MHALDIVIPTKDRYSTLIPTVRAILKALAGRDYKIIVYDNSQGAAPEADIDWLLSQPEINYFHDKEVLDAPQNFNRAIDKSSAEYCTLIGDDDFVLPSIFDAITEIKKQDLECLIQQRPTYYWPGVKFDREFDFFSPASLQIQKQCSRTIVELNGRKELDFVLKMGGVYLYNLPALYHGLVRKDLLQEIKRRYGNYIYGPSPDISIAYLLAITVKRYGYFRTAFSVAGASFNSAAGMGRRGEHSAPLTAAPTWLPKTMKENWDKRLPETWNGFTVYAQSLYLSSLAANESIEINYDALYKKILSHNYNDIDYFKENTELKDKVPLQTQATCFIAFHVRESLQRMPIWLLNFLVRMRPAFRSLQFYKGIDSPEACIDLATQHIGSTTLKI